MRIIHIGRNPDNEIVLQDPTVSRNHASLIIDGSEYIIRDNNSSNGTFINGNQIHGEARLNRHDILKVGSALVPWMNYIGEFNRASQPTIEINEDRTVQMPSPQPQSHQGNLKLPGSGAALTLGILSIVLSGIIGLILGIVGITQANKGLDLEYLQPGKYDPSSVSQAKAGKVCSIIGIVLSGLVMLIILASLNTRY